MKPKHDGAQRGRGTSLAIERGPDRVALLDETIGENLERTVSLHGDRDAIVSVHQGIRWSYAEFQARVQRLARGLLAMGLQRGDRVGLWSANNAEWILVQYATAEIGVILVNVNPSYRTHELAFALNQSGCRALFAAPGFKTSDYVAMVDEVRAECAMLSDVVFLGSHAWDMLCDPSAGVAEEELRERRRSLTATDPINIQYTSGTTGFPKGATLSHRNILNNGYFVAELQGFTQEDRLCVPVPFYHCFGMVMGNLGCTTHGATIVIPAEAFDPEAVLQAVEMERCTALYGVPTMFIAELAHPAFERFDLSSLRTGVM
ncbi:MAG: AMP-binding protein, partial [Actinobacteria bacterium]